VEASGTKLSKSAGSTSVKYLRENGKNTQYVFTLIASMLGVNQTINNWQQLAGIALGG
jgi:glutamyl-tRNA synthetase